MKVAEEGSDLIKEILDTWLSRTESMEVDNVTTLDEARAQEQLAELRLCFEEFKPRIEANSWCQTLLASL